MNLFRSSSNPKLGLAVFIFFLALAVWTEFFPKEEPGTAELLEADNLIAVSPTEADVKKACGLYRDAVTAGNRDAALGLAGCISTSVAGTDSARRSLRYAVLLLGVEAAKNGEKCREELAALGASDEEIRAAKAIDIVSVLKMEFLPDGTVLQK